MIRHHSEKTGIHDQRDIEIDCLNMPRIHHGILLMSQQNIWGTHLMRVKQLITLLQLILHIT